MIIKTLNSEMTGGGVMTYYGELTDGRFFAFGNGVVSVFDSDYAEVFTEEFFSKTGGDTSDWEQEHGIYIILVPNDLLNYPNEVKDLIAEIIFEAFEKENDKIPEEFMDYIPFKVAMIQKSLESGLDREEIVDIMDKIDGEEELIPIDVESDVTNSCAMGFIDYSTADLMNFDIKSDSSAFVSFVRNIINDKNNESPSSVYKFSIVSIDKENTDIFVYLGY